MGTNAADFVAFDLETTGLSPKSDRVIEIGAVRFGPDLQPVDRFELLVDPAMPIPLPVQRLTGLTHRDGPRSARPQEPMAQFADFCDATPPPAPPPPFDTPFSTRPLPP